MPGDIARNRRQITRRVPQLFIAVIKTRDHQRDDLHPQTQFVRHADRIQHMLQHPAHLAVSPCLHALQVNFISAQIRAQRLQRLARGIAVGDHRAAQPCRAGFFEHIFGPFGGDQRFVVGRNDHIRAAALSQRDHLLRRDALAVMQLQRALRVARRLR